MVDKSIILEIEKTLGSFHLSVSYSGGGDCIGILGASGCGKSMTLKCAAGIEIPDRGRIVIGGRTLYDSEKRINLRPQVRKVGYLFQNYALFPTMTVEQNIMAGLKGPKEDRQRRAEEMIEKFQLTGLEKLYPAQLSGGQQQRTALARILVCNPDAILLDEPFSAMDVFLKERLRLELAAVLRDFGGVSVVVTHDRDEAYQLCDRLLLMDSGRIIASGETKALFENPGTVRAASLTGCKNISRIVKVGSRRVLALDWEGLEFVTAQEVGQSVTHIGIRAHDFYPAGEGAINPIPVRAGQVTELPFEWYVTLSHGIWWKTQKELHSHDKSVILPDTLTVDPKNIMLLTDESA